MSTQAALFARAASDLDYTGTLRRLSFRLAPFQTLRFEIPGRALIFDSPQQVGIGDMFFSFDDDQSSVTLVDVNCYCRPGFYFKSFTVRNATGLFWPAPGNPDIKLLVVGESDLIAGNIREG